MIEKCHKCGQKIGLYKEFIEEDVILHCTLCSWKTERLPRHEYGKWLAHIPTSEAHKDIEKDWE